jgi:hypothetical protein
VPENGEAGLGLEELMKTFSEMAPRDEIEGMILSKLIALHRLGMRALSRIENGATHEIMNMHTGIATKLLRLENETIEAFTRYRNKGAQKYLVQHISIEDGGKAIVQSNVIAGGGVGGERGGIAHG